MRTFFSFSVSCNHNLNYYFNFLISFAAIIYSEMFTDSNTNIFFITLLLWRPFLSNLFRLWACLKMPCYKKYILHWYHGIFKATPAKNLYIAYLMLTKLQVLKFVSFILTILILRGRRKNFKVFNEASGVM